MATLARSDSAKSSSPRIAAAVISSTFARVPVWSASISITSPVISVESTSKTISRFARRAMPTRSTAMSTPAARADLDHGRPQRLVVGRPDRQFEAGHRVVGDPLDRLDVDPELAEPQRQLADRAGLQRPAEHHDGVGRERGAGRRPAGRSRPGRPCPRSPIARSTSSCRPSGSSGVPTSTPRVSCPRMTAWSMSSTSTRWVASAVNSTPVTPGRSGPVTVISTEDIKRPIGRSGAVTPPNGAVDEPGTLALRDLQVRAGLGLVQRLPAAVRVGLGRASARSCTGGAARTPAARSGSAAAR